MSARSFEDINTLGVACRVPTVDHQSSTVQNLAFDGRNCGLSITVLEMGRTENEITDMHST